MAMTARFIMVSTALAMCAVIALFALAADQYSSLRSTDELESQSAISALKAMLQKQSQMDKMESGLFAKLVNTKDKKAAVHHQAAAKKQNSKNDDEVAKLKAELAAAEAKEGSHEAKKSPATSDHENQKVKKFLKVDKHLSGLSKIKHEESFLKTGKDFQKIHGSTAKKLDKKIAKDAGLKDMGWMGSKSYIDAKLEALHCDPTNFMCTGTKAEKMQALKMIQQIQKSISGDAHQVQAYAWKEEHALPPAPKM